MAYRVSNLRLPLLVLLVSLFAQTTTSVAAQECQVLSEAGEDRTAELYVEDPDYYPELDNIDGYVLCNGHYACKNFTISNCPAVRCQGKEACYLATLTGISQVLDCTEMHSCHRSIVDFHNATDDQPAQTMLCQGEGACDVATIVAHDVHLECFGRKSCRKVDATIDTVHCTHGDSYYEACTGYAGLYAHSCVMCGWQGCNEHVNICRFRHDDDSKYKACATDAAFGPGCTDEQIDAIVNEIEAAEAESGEEDNSRR